MTPIREQYLEVKKRYSDCILFFRLGDFYETFDEDAKITARDLEITLTSREMGKGIRVPLAGIPVHTLDVHLSRLIKKGHKIAICEQLGTSAHAKGLVERDVVRVVTPGTVTDPALLSEKSNNYLAAMIWHDDIAGLAHIDITTGEFLTTELSTNQLPLELERLAPAELLISNNHPFLNMPKHTSATYHKAHFENERSAREVLLSHFGTMTLEPFGCENHPLAIWVAAFIIDYLGQTEPAVLNLVNTLATYSTNAFMILDTQSRRNLELFDKGRLNSESPHLLSVLDMTETSAGGRLLRKWLGQPLLNLDDLNRRQKAVAFFVHNGVQRKKVISTLSPIADIERILNRTRLNRATPREMLSLKKSLRNSQYLQTILNIGTGPDIPEALISNFNPCPDLVHLLEAAITEEPGIEAGDGKTIKEGFSKELDELRQSALNAQAYIASLERHEKNRTGIKSLRIGHNRIFGYYIEITNPNLSHVPEDYQRRQTLVAAERFTTPQLKEYEDLIFNARERIQELEQELIRQVNQQIGLETTNLVALSSAIAHADVFASLSEVAVRNEYVQPQLTQDYILDIKDGRHPVVEKVLPVGKFVPNDVLLTAEDGQITILTGPNMAGKSTYIRQVALIVLMAQIGSFVPARTATIGLVDRIFTRIGLQDDLSAGESTFMMEMIETATILQQATARSLVILDEIGRGTSTYDGLSIARAVAEYLHNSPRLGCRTLFATHYHELTDLARYLPKVRNYTVAVTEEEDRVIFLHRIIPGEANRSYGVHVAQLAGLPQAVVNRAYQVLRKLETGTHGSVSKIWYNHESPNVQLPLMSESAPLIQELEELDITNLTPLEAINKLFQLQGMLRRTE